MEVTAWLTATGCTVGATADSASAAAAAPVEEAFMGSTETPTACEAGVDDAADGPTGRDAAADDSDVSETLADIFMALEVATAMLNTFELVEADAFASTDTAVGLEISAETKGLISDTATDTVDTTTGATGAIGVADDAAAAAAAACMAADRLGGTEFCSGAGIGLLPPGVKATDDDVEDEVDGTDDGDGVKTVELGAVNEPDDVEAINTGSTAAETAMDGDVWI